jgi:hypothetical protein
MMQIGNYWPTEYVVQTLLQGSILSVHGSSRLHFELIKLLDFDFNADPDQQPW